jgi:hypothetical protein
MQMTTKIQGITFPANIRPCEAKELAYSQIVAHIAEAA